MSARAGMGLMILVYGEREQKKRRKASMTASDCQSELRSSLVRSRETRELIRLSPEFLLTMLGQPTTEWWKMEERGSQELQEEQVKVCWKMLLSCAS